MDLEDLRRAGVSSTRLRWLTNPVRDVLFRLALPYFEVIARIMQQQGETQVRLCDRVRLEEENRRRHEVRAELQPEVLAEAVIHVHDRALASVSREVRRELAGARNEVRAISHRFTSIEDMLHTISQWVEGVSDETKAEFAKLRERIETAERIGTSGVAADPAVSRLRGSSLTIASGPYGRFLVRHPDVVGDAIIRGEFWDEHLKQAIEAHSDPERVAIDAGAYIGFHSIFLSRHFARVHAFEPQVAAYNLLRANIELNGRRNIEAANIGLYDRACWLRLAPDEVQEISIPRSAEGVEYAEIGNAAALAFVTTEEPATDAVRAVAVDSLALDRVGFIKVDTQGADFRVLQGAEATIRRCRPVIAFEFERDLSGAHATGWPEMQAFFNARGYSLAEARRTADGKQADYVATPA